ncbi:MAG: T9SS type A sorting domain-containing protein [bacterium]
MIHILLIPLLLTSFTQKWYFPQGTRYGGGKMCIGDTDRDGHDELIFSTYGVIFKIFIYELHLPDVWEVDSISTPGGDLLWDSGDFDVDGLYDLLIQFHIENPQLADGITIYESPDSFSYPTQEVWRDTVGFPLVSPICTYDIDQDSYPEIAKVIGDTTDFDMYERIANNSYGRIFRDTFPGGDSPMSTLAFGDFDCDERNEFVLGYSGGRYNIWECAGNNLYERVIHQYVPTGNIKDCFTVPDADQDGKLEFVLKGYIPSTGRIETFFLEAVGNDTFAIIDSFFCYGGLNEYSGGHSDVGDVDGDSIPEIVLEACQNVFILKAAGNDSFYVWETLPGHNTGSNVRVFDFDNNGLAEIVISGNNETHIYEYEPGGIEEHTLGKSVNIGFTCLPNIVENDIHLSFTLLQQTQVSLNIYNNLGQRVRSIYAGRQTAGCHSQKIGLTAFAAGIYFVQLKTPDQVIIQKVVKIK